MTNKPEVKRFNILTYQGAIQSKGAMCVLASDYEALQAELQKLQSELTTVKKVAHGNIELLEENKTLQAECEKMRKDAERYRHLRDRLTGPRFDNLFFLELYNAGCFDHPDDVDEEIDAAMEAPDAP